MRKCVNCMGMLLIGFLFLGWAEVFAAGPDSSSEIKPAPTVDTSGSKWRTFAEDRDFEFSLATGLRNDSLEWNIAGNSAGTNPNILSELDWSDVDSTQVTLANRSRFQRHVYCRTTFSYAAIQDGTVRDSDYDSNGRGDEWSRSISETTGDQMWDISSGGGYAFILNNDRLLVAPLIGFSYHKQNLRIENGYQAISTRSPAPTIGPLSSELNSTYFARWMGPWVGVDLRYLTEKRGPDYLSMAFGLSVEIHYADFHGEGNWNLRSDLDHPISFEHDADGMGVCISGEWLMTLADGWDLSFSASYQHWSTRSGTDRKYLAGGGSSDTRLNKVKWVSSSFMIGANYHF